MREILDIFCPVQNDFGNGTIEPEPNTGRRIAKKISTTTSHLFMHLLRFGLRMRKQHNNNGEDTETLTVVGEQEGENTTDFANQVTSSKSKVRSNFAKKSFSTTTQFHNNKVLIYVVTLIGLIFAFSSYSDIYGVSAMPRCHPCPNGDCPDPPEGTCAYGIVTNYCGRRVCAKGPGEVCGTGMFKMLGTCGEGMYCNCGRCIGCSVITMECYDKTCTK